MLQVVHSEDDALGLHGLGRGPAVPERIAITSPYGAPLDPKTWSGAPNNVASAFERLGTEVVGIHPDLKKSEKAAAAIAYFLSGYGALPNSESLFRSAPARRFRARHMVRELDRHDIRTVLHTGTLVLPLARDDGRDHYLYCDQTWDLSLRYRPDRGALTSRACSAFDSLERRCCERMRHIFTFGDYVRTNLIEHYGIAPGRVTAVGSGMGQIDPYFGMKDYGAPHLLFVAKHYFEEKGGPILLEAFRRAKIRRPDLRLTVVWDGRDETLPRRHPDVEFLSQLRWGRLTALYRQATLLVEPMLNDPWGQVYLEALISRTPVIGLDRNGLPEIAAKGAHGFLVREADGAALADAILEAISDPARLARMGLAGQRYVLRHYSWDRTVEKMVAVMANRSSSTTGEV